MATVNEDLYDAHVRHQIYLQRFSTGAVRRLIVLLNQADRELVEKLQTAPPETWETFSHRRLNRLLAKLREINKRAYELVGASMQDELVGLAAAEVDFEQRQLAGLIPVAVDIITPSEELLLTVVTSDPFQGRILKEFVKDLETNRLNRLRDQIRLGVVEGETVDQIIRRVRGTRAANFNDGILGRSRRDIEVIVRTAINHVATRSREQLYNQNTDLVKGVQWTSTLDSRTSAICRARDGMVFDVNKGPRPPAHPNCRSTTTPVIKSWKELGIDLDEAPPGTRASLNGQVPADLRYGDWLKLQPMEFVEDVLGKRKARLFRDGGLSMDKFVDVRGQELTLAELRTRNRAVWNRVFPEDAAA